HLHNSCHSYVWLIIFPFSGLVFIMLPMFMQSLPCYILTDYVPLAVGVIVDEDGVSKSHKQSPAIIKRFTAVTFVEVPKRIEVVINPWHFVGAQEWNSSVHNCVLYLLLRNFLLYCHILGCMDMQGSYLLFI
ncbi:hypothetical protein ACJX0J_038064, partial [Zea mays]